MSNPELSQLLSNLIMNLNENSKRRFFRKFYARKLIKYAKKQVKSIITKTSYDAYDIYKFLLFIDSAEKLNLFDHMDNIVYTCYKPNNLTKTSTGVLKTEIQYGSEQILNVLFKPIVTIDSAKIDMQWIISDNNPSLIDNVFVSTKIQNFSSTVNYLTNNNKNTKFVTQTKILENSSYGILYHTFIICMENIFNKIEMRYLNETK